jgi:hypothetical protein
MWVVTAVKFVGNWAMAAAWEKPTAAKPPAQTGSSALGFFAIILPSFQRASQGTLRR